MNDFDALTLRLAATAHTTTNNEYIAGRLTSDQHTARIEQLGRWITAQGFTWSDVSEYTLTGRVSVDSEGGQK